ncbi:MAG: S1C family serine protease [Culicoidibacterales bacterium]
MKKRIFRILFSVLLVVGMMSAVLYSVTKYVDWKKLTVQDSVTVNTPMTRVTAEVKNSVYGIYNVSDKGRASGSGFIYKIDGDKGYLLTNAHVVKDAKELHVFFETGAMIPAKLEGRDENFDLAVVSVNKADLQPGAKAIPLSEEMPELGADVLAMGTPLHMTFYNTTTVGVISGVSRVFIENTVRDKALHYNDFLQVDAAINHGNSGGPLFNQKGEVIGVNARGIAGDTESPVSNLSFSIPVYVIKSVLPYIEKGESKSILSLGIAIDGYYEESYGSLVEKKNDAGNTVSYVQVNSPAEKAGFAIGDIIVSLDGSQNIKTTDIAHKLINSKKGDILHFQVKRGGQTIPLDVNLNKEVK